MIGPFARAVTFDPPMRPRRRPIDLKMCRASGTINNGSYGSRLTIPLCPNLIWLSMGVAQMARGPNLPSPGVIGGRDQSAGGGPFTAIFPHTPHIPPHFPHFQIFIQPVVRPSPTRSLTFHSASCFAACASKCF